MVLRLSKLLKDDLKFEIIGIFLLVLALLALASFYSTSLGAVGNFIGRVLNSICGEGRIMVPVILAILGLRLMFKRNRASVTMRFYGILLIFMIILTVMHLQHPVEQAFTLGYAGAGGGLTGALFSWLLQKAFGQTGTYIILTAAALIALLLLTNKSLTILARVVFERSKNWIINFKEVLINFLFTEVDEEKEPELSPPVFIDNSNDQDLKAGIDEKVIAPEAITGPINYTQMSIEDVICYQLPPLTLLSPANRGKSNKGQQDLADQAKKLEETMASFGIKAKVTQVSRGPSVTRFEMQPPVGVKVSKIINLSTDISLAMAAPDVRIEAPIPGKAAIGIEIPNKKTFTVNFRCLLENRKFIQAKSCLTIALGQDIAGTTIVADLSKMPHLLIAGATGSGKSVFVNTLIFSILFKASPDEVKLLMIDPKMVELANYNGIPHLVSPVVTNPKKAAISLRWAVKEMERRYNLFAAAEVRDITRYNNLLQSQPADSEQKQLPLIVVIIDELADLMMVAPADVEDAICRLAQMARAAGIHLVVATQRPSVDVITGLIKANIPSRVSFAVSSQIDSRTILDMPGAEKLLGKGDMLFYPVGASKPVRVQGAYISDQEVAAVMMFLKKQAKPDYSNEITVETPEQAPKSAPEDQLLPQATKILIEQGQASISMLQRRLHIGYARAARLIDIMEQRGIVGGYEGSKPRAVLMTLEQFNQTFEKDSSSK